MEVWNASYRWYGSYGAYTGKDAIVVANTKSEALGLCLQEYASTDALNWTLCEIDVTQPGVHHVSSDES